MAVTSEAVAGHSPAADLKPNIDRAEEAEDRYRMQTKGLPEGFKDFNFVYETGKLLDFKGSGTVGRLFTVRARTEEAARKEFEKRTKWKKRKQ